MPIDLKLLEAERDALKETLRTIDLQQRELDAQQKVLRQREMRAKRRVEALETLIDVDESAEPSPEHG